MKIYIKNMVCERCNLAVSSLLKEMSIIPVSVELGQVDFGDQDISSKQVEVLTIKLNNLGFEILDNKKSCLIDKIKTTIVQLVHHQDSLTKIKLSDFLKSKINYDYNHISHLFSSIEGVTIEQYYINQKIEKAKELLVYDEHTTTEIAHRLGYSSLAHMSGQFKKVTGMTPSQFKKLNDLKLRKPLDQV